MTLLLTFLTFLKTTLGKALALGLGGTLLVGALYLAFRPTPYKTATFLNTQQVYVDRQVLVPNDVTRFISDPKDRTLIEKLLAENKVLKLATTSVTSSTGVLSSSGGAATTPVVNGAFEDYQLKATDVGPRFSYELKQAFQVVTTTGVDSSGNPIGQTSLVQQTPSGPVEVPLKTTSIHATPAPKVWNWGLKPQLGLAVRSKTDIGGTLNLQVLRHTNLYSLASPTLFLRAGEVTYGVTPVSLNLGGLPHSPLNNLWVGVGVDNKKQGFATVTLTF